MGKPDNLIHHPDELGGVLRYYLPRGLAFQSYSPSTRGGWGLCKLVCNNDGVARGLSSWTPLGSGWQRGGRHTECACNLLSVAEGVLPPLAP
jgi:hypothetical protein